MKAYTFAEARLRAYTYLPYLSKHIMSLVPVENEAVGTMGVDQHGRCYYNPAQFAHWSMDESAGVILHEDLHLVLNHVKRCREHVGEKPSERQTIIWNLAVDCVVNQILMDACVPLPAKEHLATIENLRLPANKTAEEYYDLLMQRKIEFKASNWGGSSADGVRRPWEEGPPDVSGTPGLSEHDKRMLERIVAEAIAERGRQAGSQGGYLDRFAREVLHPRVDPVREIRAKVKYAASATHGYGDYTWAKMNRRVPPGGLRLPCHIRPVPRFVLIADTSGSMREKDLGLCLGVVAAVLSAYPAEQATVIAGDVSAKQVNKVFRPEQVQLAGGGGTDMGAIVIEAAEMQPKPDVIIVCTDGETPWPAAPVHCRVVACLTRRPEYADAPPAWIDCVYLEAA